MTGLELCGIHFSDTTTPEQGLIYEDLIGWDGIPDARGADDPIPGAHGSYESTEILRESRAITLLGAIVADSVTEYFTTKRRLEAMHPIGALRVDQGDGTWSSTIKIQRLSIPDAQAGLETQITVDMLAPDPVRYRDPEILGPVGLPTRAGGLRYPARAPWNLGRREGGTLTLHNRGELPVYPTLRIEGGGFTTVSAGDDTSGRRLEYGALAAGSTLTLDARARRALLDGRDVTRELARRGWPVVPPGETHRFSFRCTGVVGAPQLSVEYQIGAW